MEYKVVKRVKTVATTIEFAVLALSIILAVAQIAPTDSPDTEFAVL
ncbi:MAG: hypothetical protein ACK4SY_10410 [Pyrobaculum sp.]